MDGPRRPHTGRRRNDAAREAILDAAFRLVSAPNPEALTIDAIAAEAGVGRQTIYRWWPSKGAVVADALARHARVVVPDRHTGSFTGDLAAFLIDSFAGLENEGYAARLRQIVAEAQHDEHVNRVLADFTAVRRAALRVLLERGRAAGESRPVPTSTCWWTWPTACSTTGCSSATRRWTSGQHGHSPRRSPGPPGKRRRWPVPGTAGNGTTLYGHSGVVVIPVSDLDRAKEFYGDLAGGSTPTAPRRRLPHRPVHASGLRVLGPVRHEHHVSRARLGPGPVPGRLRHRGRARRSARARRRGQRGVPRGSRAASRSDGEGRSAASAARDPSMRSYGSFATFSDPDGNSWLLQEITTRLPGRRRRRRDVIRSAATWRARCGARRPPTASTRSASARPTRTGPTGTPRTWWRSRPGRSCRRERHGERGHCCAALTGATYDIDGGQQFVS